MSLSYLTQILRGSVIALGKKKHCVGNTCMVGAMGSNSAQDSQLGSANAIVQVTWVSSASSL